MPPLFTKTLAGCRLGVIGRAERAPQTPVEELEFVASCSGVSPDRLHFLTQVHKADCLEVTDAFSNYARADAFFTVQPGPVLVIRSADCLPVFVIARSGARKAVALIHAGWRGMAQGIVRKTVEAMGSSRTAAELDVVFGPAISAPVYEVGADVALHFQAVKRQGDKFLLDLCAEACGQLPAHARIHTSFSACTRNDDRFYSHRRGDSGRNYSFIWMDS